jgi:hypothetical protein
MGKPQDTVTDEEKRKALRGRLAVIQTQVITEAAIHRLSVNTAEAINELIHVVYELVDRLP